MLNIYCGDDVDTGVEQRLHVLPALLMGAARHVGVGEFIDERDFWFANQ